MYACSTRQLITPSFDCAAGGGGMGGILWVIKILTG